MRTQRLVLTLVSLLTVPAAFAALPATVIAHDTFDADTIRLGLWERVGAGKAEIRDGALHVSAPGGGGFQQGGVIRPVTLDPAGAVFEIRVQPNSIWRLAMEFTGPGGFLVLEIADWGFCICWTDAFGQPHYDLLAPGPRTGTSYVLRAIVLEEGSFTAQVYDGPGVLLATRTAEGIGLTPASIDQLGLRAWNWDGWQRRSDYRIEGMALLPAAAASLAPLV